MFKFENLKVWQKSQQLCVNVIDEIKRLPNEYRFTIGSNLLRAVISIPNNIAEGSGRRSKKEACNFYGIARGSVYEVINVLIVLKNISLITTNKFNKAYKDCEEIAKMISGLINKDK